MEQSGAALAHLSQAADVLAQSGGRVDESDFTALASLVEAAHQDGHSVDAIAHAARLSLAATYRILRVPEPEALRNADGDAMWRIELPPD